MTRIIGRLRKVGIAKETVKGTGVVPSYWLPVTASDMSPMVETMQKEGAIGRIEDSYDSDIVKKHNEPSIEGYVTDKGVGLLLLSALGSVSSAAKIAPNTSVYDHTFSVLNSNEHPALTLSFKDDNIAKWVPYCMLSSLELNAVVGDYLKYAASFVGKFEANQALTPSFTEENIFVARHITVKIADSVATLGAASALNLQEIRLNINKNVEPIFSFGSNEPSFINNKQLELTGSFNAIESDTTWRDLFTANTEKVMQITITNSDVTIGTSANPGIVVTLNRVKFNPYSEDIGLADMIKETVEFKAQYDVADAQSIGVVLTNLVTSY